MIIIKEDDILYYGYLIYFVEKGVRILEKNDKNLIIWIHIYYD